MSSYGNPPQDPYGQSGQDPYGQQQPSYGSNPYAQNPYGPDPYGQGGYGQPGYGAGQFGYAHWGKRVVATLIDGLLGAVAQMPYFIGSVMAAASTELTTDPATGQVTSTGETSGLALALMGLGIILGLAFWVWNVLIKQGSTGYTIGKGLMGIKLIKLETGQPIGAGMSFVRQIAHIIDSIPCGIGYLWPLWDSKRQTFADKIVGTVVIDQPQS